MRPLVSGIYALAEGRMTVPEFLVLFHGKRIPSNAGIAREEQDRRAYTLTGQVGPSTAAKRLGISRSAVYRAVIRHLGRLRNAA